MGASEVRSSGVPSPPLPLRELSRWQKKEIILYRSTLTQSSGTEVAGSYSESERTRLDRAARDGEGGEREMGDWVDFRALCARGFLNLCENARDRDSSHSLSLSLSLFPRYC